MIQLNSTIRNDIKAGVQNFEYLININDEVYVATRKQMLRQIPVSDLPIATASGKSDEIYFEDAGMKITDLSEKIDLKTKKTQLGNSTITFANFSAYIGRKEKKFSDKFKELSGKNLKIYFKTQSCKTISECLLVAQLKITRIKHDDKKITISANDLSIDSTYKEIPDNDYVLLKDINTFDHYSLNPVPTLYGHLENAPAIVYKEEESNTLKIKLIPDTSYFDDTEIGGILPYQTDGENGIVFNDGDAEFGGTLTNKFLQLVRQDVLKISLGDYLCDVPCLPYQQTRENITDMQHVDKFKLHTKAQWFSRQDHVLLNFNIGEETDESIEEASLWCAKNQKPLTQETLTFTIRSKHSSGVINGYEGYYSRDYNNEMNDVKDEHNPVFDGVDRVTYTIGVQKFKFPPLSGFDLNDKLDEDGKEVYKTDAHFLGSVKVTQDLNTPSSTHEATFIHSVFSPPIIKDTAVDASSFQDDVGYPSSLTSEMNGGTADDFNFNNKFARTTIELQGYADTDNQNIVNYRTSFTSSLFDYRDKNSFVSRYREGAEFKYPTMDATTLSLYYLIEDSTGGTLGTAPNTRLNITSEWRDVEMRKVWSNKQIFEKDFFVNAKGKLGDVEPNIKDISGNMIIKHEGDGFSAATNNEGFDNLHFTELYKYLTNDEYKSKHIDGEYYALMLASYNPTNDEYTYLYDIEIQDFKFMVDGLPVLTGSENFYLSNNEEETNVTISHSNGWIIKYNAKLFGSSQYVNFDNNFLAGVRLVYGKRIYENQNIVAIQTYEEEDLFETFNSKNRYEFGDYSWHNPPDWQPYAQRGYTQVMWNEELESKKIIERPHEIIQDLLSKQDAVINFDDEKINKIYEQTPEYKLAFSINERKNTSEIIQKICQQSPIYYRYRGRDRKIVVDFIKNKYDDDDLSGVIETQRLINFSFDRTKIEDSCLGGVFVNYGYNYATEKFDKRTGSRDLGAFRTDYAQYYGIDDLKGYQVEIDAPYIQDKGTAEYYRDYYFELNKQQKITCKFELSMSDGIQYEVGDIIKFDANPNKTQPYGIDLTTNNQIIDQESTPYFFITKVQKSLFRVKIECVQTHELKYDLPQVSLLGDINLDGQVTSGNESGSDLFLLLEMVTTAGLVEDKTYNQLQEEGWSLQQIVNADMNQDGIVGYEDVILFTQEFGGTLA